jgi:hypothetical protein
MMLQVGKKFRTAAGDPVMLTARMPKDEFQWLGYRMTDCKVMTFHDDGRATNLESSPDDIVGEATGGDGYLCVYDYGNGHALGFEVIQAGSPEAKRKGFVPGKQNGPYHIATVPVSWNRGRHDV